MSLDDNDPLVKAVSDAFVHGGSVAVFDGAGRLLGVYDAIGRPAELLDALRKDYGGKTVVYKPLTAETAGALLPRGTK